MLGGDLLQRWLMSVFGQKRLLGTASLGATTA